MNSSIVDKVFDVLTTISESSRPLTFVDLCRQTGLNKSSLHRILNICLSNKSVQYLPENKSYALGSKLFDLVRFTHKGNDIQNYAYHEMTRLHSITEENVTIGVPFGVETLYLSVLDSKYPEVSYSLTGMREPVHCSSSGKAWMAFLPEPLIESKMSTYDFVRFTPTTIVDGKEFKEELRNTRQRGIGTSDREKYDFVVGIAAPVFNYLSSPIAVLNIWTSPKRYSLDDLVSKWGEELKSSAERVTELIGGVPPS